MKRHMMDTAPKFWKTKGLLSTALLPLGCVYSFASSVRTWTSTPYVASVPVICVGNITVGGTGKTPICMSIVKDLSRAGYKNVYITSKGYGGDITTPTKVDINTHTAHNVGDEPLLMAHAFNVVISKCRRSGIQHAETLGADIIIMDDGLQNPLVHKNKTIVVIDALDGFSNDRIFPSGPLRQKKASLLSNCDAIIITSPYKNHKTNMAALGLEKHTNKVYKAHFDVTKKPFEDRQSVVAFAGIGNPEKFYESIKLCGYPIRAKASYPDHYPYTDSDLENLHAMANKALAKLITTEKDFVRLSPTQQKGITPLAITARITPNTLIDIIKDIKI